MRTRWYLIAGLLVVLALAGCSPSAEPAADSSSDEPAATSEEAATEEAAESEGVAAPKALEPETDGERTALSQAQTEESRKWASGDVVNGTPVAGDPFLVGYGFIVHDGTTFYQVHVLDGAVTGFFGRTAADTYVSGPVASANATIEPQSARQRAAFDAAVVEIAKVNPNATQGGLTYYNFFYPQVEPDRYPHVALYASPEYQDLPHATGGAFGWPEE